MYGHQRIIRSPFVLRGRRMISFGKELTTGVGCRIEAFIADENKSVKLRLGNRIQMNDYVHISAIYSIDIGDDVLIASHVFISDSSHGSYNGDDNDSNPIVPPIKRYYPVASVIIGNRVWIGEGVIIMPGTFIGQGSIIGAHSVVKGTIPDNCIAVGTPIRIIKRFNPITGKWEKTNPDGSFIEK